MAERPYRVFLSAASADLKSLRALATATLEANAEQICPHGPLKVVVQENFPPDYRAVWEILRQKILECDAAICLVGFAYGREPRDVPPGFPRRSYTQLEYDIARALAKPVFLFRADDREVLDPFDEAPEFRKLQEDYREGFRSLDQVRQAFRTTDELLAQLRSLRLPLYVAAPATPQKPINLPETTLGRLFKGRDGFLADLRAKLGAGFGRAAGVLAVQSILGLGGVGKTRLAIEYAWQNQSDYTALLFVFAATPADLRRNLAELAGPLVLDLKEVAGAKEEEVRLAAALRWLETHPGWFLLLDNVDTDEAAREAERLLTRLRFGHVVITSRLKEWVPGVESLELDVLAPEASAAFLLERTAGKRRPSANDDAVARELARELDGLALALEQAGAYVCHLRCSLADYLARWCGQQAQVLEWFDERQMKYPKSVAATWQTTRDRLSPGARGLLEILAWFAPDPIPEAVVSGEATQPLAAEALGGADVALALAELEKYSMLKRQLAGEAWALVLHRLVQEIGRWRQADDLRRQRLETALRLADAAATGQPHDVRTWSLRVPLSPHVRALVDEGECAGIYQPTARLMNDLASLLRAKARYAEAEPLFRRALAIDERVFGPDHPALAADLRGLGRLLWRTDQSAEAEGLLCRALAIDERGLGPDHPAVAADLRIQAGLLRDVNRLAEAEPLYRRALAINERCFGPEHPEVAGDLRFLAELLEVTDRRAEAEPLYRRALTIDERSYGPEHPAVASDVRRMARLLWCTSRPAEAEALLRRALAIDERSYGPDHPAVALDLNNLAGVLAAADGLADAQSLLLQRLLLEGIHPDAAADRLAEAEALLRRALAIDEHSYGPEHPNVAGHLGSLAELLRATGRPADAEPLARRAVGIFHAFTRRAGHEHPYLHVALRNYRGILKDLGRSDPEIEAKLNSLDSEPF
jgi:tetratricopeptide (TPR) repeat protein